MFVNSEKELEDYICENIDRITKILKKVYGKEFENEKIEFVGRQINVGGQFIDLLFKCLKIVEPYNCLEIHYIVLELKFRNLIERDLGQICKYLNIIEELNLYDDINNKYSEVITHGVLIGIDLDLGMQEVQMYLDRYNESRIKICTLKSDINFRESNYIYTDKYRDSLQFDERILEDFNGKEKDDRPEFLDG